MISERVLVKKDLNLFLVLVVLYKERNTEKTAERLFVTQSAISKGLKKLREQLNDPLFVRVKNGFVPTSFCDEIVAEVEPALLTMEQIYKMSGSVNPEVNNRELSVAISSSFTHGFSEKLFSCLREKFPNTTISISIWSDATEKNLLDGKIQLGINYSSLRISKELKSKRIIRPIDINFLVRKSHPLANQIVSAKDLSQYPFVESVIPNYTHQVSKLERALYKLGLPANVILRSDNANVRLTCIKNSDAILPVHSFTAKALSEEYSVLQIDFDPNDYTTEEYAAIFYSDKFLSTERRRLVESCIEKCLSFHA
ncbi:LysR family transcriptional regulator [Vibrio sp. B1FLJ16]|uniref:LysR family transcriptional regulator n=1 Tax=Vibrio sp. B1FLJ16 TaxID=2751178 RepID=UPI0015F7340A|nr:LysR family transcriptional regulator [Vibrio sp. B1FLJ16]CAD7807174.1 Bacterial regulatory helix-turn-helix protein [Vibrio sp. B1FLJ16]CAE6905022.1 Bacterial regulatory helix-turn-helix protein [Vibrio sp. B1FLJ16]